MIDLEAIKERVKDFGKHVTRIDMRALVKEVERLKLDRSRFKLWGSDECRGCGERVTLYWVGCWNHKGHENDS